VWWRTVLVFVLLVLFVNIVISFLLAKFYPSHCVRTSLHIQSPHVQRESLYILEDPRQLYLHVDTPLLPLAEKDVVVRSAYVVNSRLGADAGYKNSTVILLEVKKRLLDENAFEGCGVGRYASTTFEVISIDAESCGTERGRFTHTQALLYCYDVSVNHLDRAWVTYRKEISDEMSTFQAKAELPLLLHGRSAGRGGIVVCAAMLPHYTPFVEDWISYQQTIGVDHIHLILESTFLNLGSFDREFLHAVVDESYLTVEFWHQWLNETDICDHSLDLAWYSCALRFQDFYSHVIFSDPRDFFIPSGPSLSRLPDFLNHWCPATHCHFQWKNLFYRHCEMAGGNGNVTLALPVTGFSAKDHPFTVYRSDLIGKGRGLFVQDASEVTDVPALSGYFAHIVKFSNSSDVRILPGHERCSPSHNYTVPIS
jgi:hypothetical protein